MTQNEISVLGATRFVVGLSQILRLTPGDHLYAESFKILSGGGTLEIVDPAYSGSSSAPATGWNQGYPVGLGEVISLRGGASVYLAATGATMTGCMLLGRTYGATWL